MPNRLFLIYSHFFHFLYILWVDFSYTFGFPSAAFLPFVVGLVHNWCNAAATEDKGRGSGTHSQTSNATPGTPGAPQDNAHRTGSRTSGSK